MTPPKGLRPFLNFGDFRIADATVSKHTVDSFYLVKISLSFSLWDTLDFATRKKPFEAQYALAYQRFKIYTLFHILIKNKHFYSSLVHLFLKEKNVLFNGSFSFSLSFAVFEVHMRKAIRELFTPCIVLICQRICNKNHPFCYFLDGSKERGALSNT